MRVSLRTSSWQKLGFEGLGSRRRIRTGVVVIGALLPGCGIAWAQDSPADPMPKPLRYEEDYSYLADETKRTDFWDPIKFIPLTDSKETYLSIGGEWRERFESFENPAFGLTGVDNDAYLLHRLLLSADLHIGEEFRTYIQLGSHHETGIKGPLGPTDEDHLDLQQGFVEATLPIKEQTHAGVRMGRQEMLFGSGRLVALRDGPNIRRSFDGFRTLYRSNALNADAFFVQTVELERGTFDDETNDDETFWGVYGVAPFGGTGAPHLDFYYLGIDREPAIFAAGIADERRHTIGARLWGIAGDFDYNLELIYQFGEFGDSDISAWGASADIGLTFPKLPLQPRIGLKADAESGDDDLGDNKLKTFNPLFPNNAYFSEAALGAPMNDLDIHPNVTLTLAQDLTLTIGWDFFWREETEDAVYDTALEPIPGTAGGGDAYVGNLITTHLQWQLDRHIELNADYTHFEAGDTIEQAGGQNVDFFMLSAAYRF